jgi:hypothetical protein
MTRSFTPQVAAGIGSQTVALSRGDDVGQHLRATLVSARPKRLLIGIGMATILIAPNLTGKGSFGPWHFTATAAGNREFREVYAFPSRQACEAQHDTMQQGVAQVLAERGGTTVGRAARRLHLSPCEAIRHGHRATYRTTQ